MSTLIQAKLIKKRWLDWAKESLHFRDQVEVPGADLVLKKLKEQRLKWPVSLCYEVSDGTIPGATFAITEGLARLKIELVMAIVGDPLDPVLLRLTQNDLEPIFREGAQTDETIVFVPATMDGRIAIDMPAIINPSELLISACGSMEELIIEIQRELPGGSVFRGN